MERFLRTRTKRSFVTLALGIIVLCISPNYSRADESDPYGAGDTTTVTALARQIAFVKSFSIAYPYQYPQKTRPGGNKPNSENKKKIDKK
jgi:hypothetical protein